ncbi:DUF4145 domain-containing protein [uncultured Agrobacterium sp.]|uniref:DUF4145 domain-containing protein n=1 Tax=uncultured Agrobacterium sp. TaxID=157277 RepID=UPI0025D33C3C|nr:DUF4145 domain-containing protein [uncultured Agrobacterium sp.]
MGVLVGDCVECKTKNVTMTVEGHCVPMSPSNRTGAAHGYTMGSCSLCEKPMIFRVEGDENVSWDGIRGFLNNAFQSADTFNISSSPLQISYFEPTRSRSILPAHLPDDVLKAFQQAETNFELVGHEEAAATMYRRALERALKFTHPDLKGSLKDKIKKLVAEGTLPSALGEWADEIRVVGNDGAHDDDVDRENLKAARMFCDSFLRYLITLPKEVELRREQLS